ncbi:MAG: GDP-L-fucose synthase [Rhodomicrobiaceae bacterium]
MGREHFPIEGKRIWICGHRGMVGAALLRRLHTEGCEILTADRRSLDLTRQADVQAWLQENRPNAVIAAAAKVGGIHANANFPVGFLADNLAIAHNVICGSAASGVRRLIFLASSCIYPRDAAQPMREGTLLTGPLELTSQWYALAKIAGLKLTEAYRQEQGLDFFTAIPANLYGPGDNFDPLMGHVIPALIRRAHEAKLKGLPAITIWGSGKPTREFMHVDDCADALVHLLKTYQDGEPVNIGVGSQTSIRTLAEAIAAIVGYDGRLEFDASKPDGTPRKSLDGARLAATGWRGGRPLKEGLMSAYRYFLERIAPDGPAQGAFQAAASHHV